MVHYLLECIMSHAYSQMTYFSRTLKLDYTSPALVQGKVAPKGLLHREPQNFDVRRSVCLRGIHVSSTKCRSHQKRSPFWSHMCFLQSNFADVTLWTPFWILEMLPLKQFCNFWGPKMDQKRCDTEVSEQWVSSEQAARTDARQNFEVLYAKAPSGQFYLKNSGTVVMTH